MNAVQSPPESDFIAEHAVDRRVRVTMFRRAQDWLRHGRGTQQFAILNALPAHVAVIDSRGLIISVNDAWRGFDSAQAMHGPGSEVGRNYLELCESGPTTGFSEARQIAAGIRSVLTGVVPIFSMDYACYSSTKQHWFALTVTPLGDRPTRGAIVIHRDITVDRRIEETLRANETRFRQMVESIRYVFFFADAVSHQILYISPAYEVISGRSCESLYANPAPWTAGIHPDDRALVQEKYETGVLAGTFEYECRIVRPDGSVRWIEVKGSPILNAAGLLVRVAGVMQDITPRKQAAQALQDTRRHIESLVNAAMDAILTVNEQSHIVLSNPAAEGMFGYTSAELCGRPIDELLPARLRAGHDLIAQPGNKSVSDDGRDATRSITGLRRSGETFQIEVSICRYNADGRSYFTAMLRDLTQRQQSADQLRECRRRLTDLLSNIELVAVMLDRAAAIEYCNDYFLKLTGWQRAEVMGKNFFEFFAPPERHDELKGVFAAMLANLPRSRHPENTILTRSGEHRLIRWNNSVLRSIQGEVIGIASIGEDITELQRSDIHLKRLSRVYTMLSEINALIVRATDRQELFNEACRIAVDAGTFKMAWIGVIDSRTLEGKVIAWYGGKAEYVSQIKLTARPEDTPDSRQPACRALQQSQPVICNDVATDPSMAELRDEPLVMEHKSLGCFPLMTSGRPTAVLALYAAEPNAFDEAETRLLSELAGNISFALGHLEKQERLNYLADYDELTGLANRRLFLERVAQYISGATTNEKVALGIIDLERFKNINQSLGRSGGDALLRQVGEWLARKLGDAALLARIGGDHFAVVFPKVKPEDDLGSLIEQTTDSFLRHPFRLNDAIFYVGAKVGIALYPDDGAEADTLLKNAEAALRKAKAAGDRYLFYAQKMTDTVAGRLDLERLLREALDREQFVLYYQPKINLLSRELIGAEALIRWNDPRTGLVLPGRFIPMLEETGLIHEVGRWALHRALKDYLRWRSSGLSAVRIAVNVSALQLRSRSFISDVKQTLAVDAAAGSALELEITESVIMEDVQHNGESLRAIRAMGVSIAIDDFGTGFSSLSYLSNLPLDTLKIDRSFVHDMTVGRQGTVLVSSIINLAHSLKLNVVAEGVETEEQSALLGTLGCDELQGDLFGRPVPSELFESTYLGSAKLA
jgi:diguanylate cyclase (GGDEF)-like protein/PAS domain S-box-containing protein